MIELGDILHRQRTKAFDKDVGARRGEERVHDLAEEAGFLGPKGFILIDPEPSRLQEEHVLLQGPPRTEHKSVVPFYHTRAEETCGVEDRAVDEVEGHPCYR